MVPGTTPAVPIPVPEQSGRHRARVWGLAGPVAGVRGPRHSRALQPGVLRCTREASEFSARQSPQLLRCTERPTGTASLLPAEPLLCSAQTHCRNSFGLSRQRIGMECVNAAGWAHTSQQRAGACSACIVHRSARGTHAGEAGGTRGQRWMEGEHAVTAPTWSRSHLERGPRC